MSKQDLLDYYLYINVDDHSWWEDMEADFKEQMKAVGIHVDRIYFSGFSSQGDGACFEGEVADWGLFLKSLGYTDSALIQHAKEHFRFSAKHSDHYYHERCVDFDVEMPMPDGYEYIDEEFVENYSPYPVDDIRSKAWQAVLQQFDGSTLAADCAEAFRGHMRDLYTSLGKEYDYLTSDEAVWDTIVANGLNDEEGEEV